MYHYCSNQAFHSIIRQRKIRLSLLSMSNDSKEGRHILDVIRKILPADFEHKNALLTELERVIEMIPAIGFCVSADGDVLSQWRGYADNAQGIALGFDSLALQEATDQEGDVPINVGLAPVAYSEAFLAKALEQDLEPVIDHYSSGRMRRPSLATILSPISEEDQAKERDRYLKASSDLLHMLIRLSNFAYMAKAEFFSEEKEWRILARFTNLGGALELPDAQFQPSAQKLTAFRDFPVKGFQPSMVKEIVLGPRNQTPEEVARLFLSSEGFEHVTVRLSIGSYR